MKKYLGVILENETIQKIIQTWRFYLIDPVRARAFLLVAVSFRRQVARDAPSKRRSHLSLSLKLEKIKLDVLI